MKALLKSCKVVALPNPRGTTSLGGEPSNGILYADIILKGNQEDIDLFLRGKAKVNSPTSWWIYSYILDSHLHDYSKYNPKIEYIVADLRKYKANLADRDITKIDREDARAVWSLYQRIWEALPDSPKIHSLPMWDILCDLCSEGWLVLED